MASISLLFDTVLGLRPMRAQSGSLVTGKGLQLERLRMEHFESWRSAREASRRHLEPWEPRWDRMENSLGAFRYRVRRAIRDEREGTGLTFLIVEPKRHRVIGGISLFNIRAGASATATIGYWMAEGEAGKGHMSDALKTICHHAFGKLGLHRIEAACLPRNERSMRLLERNGFRREGLARSYLQINGVREDHFIYSRIRETAGMADPGTGK